MYARYAKLRDEKKVKDLDVAKATGVSASTLSDWKAGRYNPKTEKLSALAKYFGVTVEYFLEGGSK